MRKSAILFVLTSLLTLCKGYAQDNSYQSKVDSLLKVLIKSPRDSSRTPILVNLWRAHINNDLDKSLQFSDSLISLGSSLKNDAILATGYQRKGIAYFYMDSIKLSNSYYKKTLALSEKNKKVATAAAMKLNISSNFIELGKKDSAFLYVNQAKIGFASINDISGVGSCFDQLADIRSDQGYHQLALENAIKASKKFWEVKDTLRWSDANRRIANYYVALKDTLAAIDFYKKAIDYYKIHNDKYFLGLSKSQLANLLMTNSEHQDEAPVLIENAIKLAVEVGSTSNEYFARKVKGYLNYHKGDFETALSIANQCLRMAEDMENLKRKSTSLILWSKIKLKQNNPEEIIKPLQNFLSTYKSETHADNVVKIYHLLYQAHSELNEPGRALKWHEKYILKNDSIYNSNTSNRIAELKVIHETEKKEAAIALQKEEINTLNEKAKVDSLTKGLYAGGALSGVALSGLLFFGFRQRMKKNKIAREKQEEIYKQEIEHKKKELASQTLHLVQKNTFIQELKENLENLKNSPEKFKTEFRRIVMLLKKENASDKDWEVFKTYFADVHNDFDQKLKTLNASISEKEIRLASFLRMKLSTKEIAATINVLPESILTSKYRLKKKLGLAKEVDLTDFLNTL